MPETRAAALRVVVIAETEGQRRRLRSLLESNSLEVVADLGLGDCRSVNLDPREADVLLINLDDTMDDDLASLENLIEHSPLPILFNEDASAVSGSGTRTIITKLRELARASGPGARPAPIPPRPVLRVVSVAPEIEREGLAMVGQESRRRSRGTGRDVGLQPAPSPEREPARRVWVLGASLGGPPALKRFFGVLPAGLPVCFLLAQHIGGGFVNLFADQLDRGSAVNVALASDGRLVSHGDALLIPVGERFNIDTEGRVTLLPEKRRRLYHPSIDDVLQTVADRYGSAAGAIIFSGMGADGARGCVDLAEVGGTVWAQGAESCIISSMPDAARRSGAVSFSGTPEVLAQRLIEFVGS